MSTETTHVESYGTATAELAILYEVQALALLPTEEMLAREVVAKATRLFGVRFLALLVGRGNQQRVLASWGFRGPGDLLRRMMINEPNQFRYSMGMMGRLGELFMEQSQPLGPREKRLFMVFARRVEDCLLRLEGKAEQRRTEEALHKSRERYRKLIEASPVGIVAHREGRVLFANQAAARMFKARSPEELVGTPVLERVQPEYHGIVRGRMDSMYNGQEGPLPTLEEKFIAVDGTLFDVEVTASATDYEGQRAALVVFYDISGRKRVESVVQRILNVFQHVSDAFLLADDEDRPTFMNDEFAKCLGYDQSALASQSMACLFHDPAVYEQLISQVRQGQEFRQAAVLLARNGKKQNMDCWVFPFTSLSPAFEGTAWLLRKAPPARKAGSQK